MAIEHNISNQYVFSSELEDILITGVTSALSFEVLLNGNSIFSSSFTPGVDGTVRIYDISTLLSAYITGVYGDFTFKIAGEETQVRVFRSNVSVASQARFFLSSYFLSSAMAKKITTLKRYETLSFYAFESCDVYVEAIYYDGRLVTKQHFLLSSTDVKVDDVNTVDVSSMNFLDYSCGELISYTVVAGRRRYTFELHDGMPEAEPALMFLNNFGVWETIYLVGTREAKTETKRSLAYINGKYTLYHLDEQKHYKAKTGVLLGGMLAIAEDLARSKSIFTLDSHGEAVDEIVITEGEFVHTNADEALPSFTITYRRCRRCSAMVDVVRPPKLFDKTFDNTFD